MNLVVMLMLFSTMGLLAASYVASSLMVGLEHPQKGRAGVCFPLFLGVIWYLHGFTDAAFFSIILCILQLMIRWNMQTQYEPKAKNNLHFALIDRLEHALNFIVIGLISCLIVL